MEFIAFKISITSIRKCISDTNVVNDVTHTRQRVITRLVVRFFDATSTTEKQSSHVIKSIRLLPYSISYKTVYFQLWNDSKFLNRIYHRSPMQTKKSQPEGKRTMPEMRSTEFPALAVNQSVGFSWSASETDV